jgi:hypothetical protein
LIAISILFLSGSDPVKKIQFLFLFLICFIQKIRRSLDDVAFAEFDRNLNFILNDILPDIVARLRNHGKYSPCLREH